MVKLNINSGARVIKAERGATLLEALAAEEIFIPSACGGQAICGYCKVKVLEGGGQPLASEAGLVEETERAKGIRLACQVKVLDDMRIKIPENLLAVKEYRCRCVRIRDLTYDIKQLRLQLPRPMSFIPGQYIQFRAPRYEGSPGEVLRAYSIASDPLDTEAIELIVRRVPDGICTTYIFEHLSEGEEVVINGPYGEFCLSQSDAPMIFIAGGSGIAPVKCLLHQIKNEGVRRKGVFFFGVRTLKDLFMVKEMRRFERDIPDFRFVPTLSQPAAEDDWHGERGRVTELVKKYLQRQSDASEYEGYLCGSPGMIESSVRVLTSFGIPKEKIYYDKFT